MIYGIEYENSGWGNEEELTRARRDAKHDAPATGDKALLYADEQPACLIAAYEHGETEAEMLARLRAHIGTFTRRPSRRKSSTPKSHVPGNP